MFSNIFVKYNMPKFKKYFLFCTISISMAFSITACTDNSDMLHVYNWGDYIDEELIREFEDETGIKVNYEMYASNEDMYVKIKNSGASYDVIFPSDYMISKMISENLLYEYDVTELENYKNISDKFKNLEFDKNNRYSVPYFWGTMGIIYNKTMVDEDDMQSWDCLFDEKYKDNIMMFDAQRDVLGIGLKKLGYSLNSTDLNELNEAKLLMAKQKNYLRAYVTENMKPLILSGEAAFGITDSGAAFQIIYEDEDGIFDYSIPKEGTNLWIDSMVIPKNSKHKEQAKQFINFMTRHDIAQRNTEYIQYFSPLNDIGNILEDGDDRWINFEHTPEELERCEVYIDLGDFTEQYIEAWNYVKAIN